MNLALATQEEIEYYFLDPDKEFPVWRADNEHCRIFFELAKKGNYLWILYVQTDFSHRNEGWCKKLISEFLTNYAGYEINWGAFTLDGNRYLKHLVENN